MSDSDATGVPPEHKCARRAKAVFLQALEAADFERRIASVNQECGDDVELKNAVMRLLKAHQSPHTILDGSGLPTTLISDAFPPNYRMGPYKLLERIGEGGMGVVYMAEQREPIERRVALKVIQPGMDSNAILARFEAERQALSMMDHPNIARIFDAGTSADGHPYFAMELVKGLPLTEYCDREKLSLRERLELFIPLLNAVQHAHQKGIIHRDLKPSNVLVALYDGKPVPKVIDFGIAKATGQKLAHRTLFTGIGQIIGTPEYMSPEQAQQNQLDVDTRSDIYSLGVLLYQLLTGVTPIDGKRLRSAAVQELIRIIQEEEPQRPSVRLSTIEELDEVADRRHIPKQKLSSVIRGDLDWIVMRALEKNRDRRYATAIGFAEDILRYLNDQPVIARPPSYWYRISKTIRRHRRPLTWFTLTAVLLMGGFAGADLLQQKTNRERQSELTQAHDFLDAERKDAGWREATRMHLQRAQDLSTGDDLLLTFSSTLAGWDASRRALSVESAERVAFSPNDQQLLITGEGAPILLDLETGELTTMSSSVTGSGPTGWNDAVPAMVVCRSPWQYELRHLPPATESVVFEATSEELSAAWEDLDDATQQDARRRLERLSQATADLRRLACYSGMVRTEPETAATEGINGRVTVFDTESGKVLCEIPCSPVSSLAVSPDGLLIAVGATDGVIQLFDVDRNERQTIRTGLGRVTALALTGGFGDSTAHPRAPISLVVGGDDRGRIEICRTDGATISRIRGIKHSVKGLRLSPDGTTLLSIGHNSVQMWNSLSGRHLLDFPQSGHRFHAAFSHGGDQIAIPGVVPPPESTSEHKNLERTVVWSLHNGDGVITLDASDAEAARVVISPDGNQLAALNYDWIVHIWDLRSRRILNTFQPPRGFDVGNAGMQFSADGTTFWFASGNRMTEYNLQTSTVTTTWKIPFGIQDQIRHDGQRLLLCRGESNGGADDIAEWSHAERNARLLEMHPDGTVTELARIDRFRGRVNAINAGESGRWFAVEGLDHSGDRSVAILDASSGMAHFISCDHTNASVPMVLNDATNSLMQLVQEDPEHPVGRLYRLTDGRRLSEYPSFYQAVDAAGNTAFLSGNDFRRILDLRHGTTLLRIKTPDVVSPYEPDFSPDGSMVAWANQNGTVSVCDIEQCRRILAAFESGH
ncbi:MAG: protein kinase [Planctomycetaceae bacterium]|nr:protein kinase [Planctomycetaceae bacterium]